MKVGKAVYIDQVKLLLQVLPLVMKCDCFALKGGSAINFFVRDLPRLSVDIDLTYVPIEEREKTVQNVNDSLRNVSEAITGLFGNINILPKKLAGTDLWIGCVVQKENAVVKIEPNLIVRGTVFPCETRTLSPVAEDAFETSLSVKTLSLADLYGGKICAALDRQHPRDLFDIKLLFEKEGLTEEIRKAFIGYLISHNRPIHELLNPGSNEMRHIFDNEFSGMTRIDVGFDELLASREQLIAKIRSDLTLDEKRFLLSVKRREPDWSLVGIKGLDKLPAVRWKLINLGKMQKKKYLDALGKLERVLGL